MTEDKSTAKKKADRDGRALDALFSFTAAQNGLAQLFARSNGMHSSDAAAVVRIIEAEELGRPLTPARLAEQVSLTTGATSILLNRLENAGHIRRTRENADRRVVTLHSTPSIQKAADAFYQPLRRQLNDVLADCSTSSLAAVEKVVGRLNSTIVTYMEEAGR